MIERRERKRHAVMQRWWVEVVASYGKAAELRAVEKVTAEGFVVGKVYRAVKVREATSADEMRDAGVAALVEVG
jgi:hypothetical protein